jgi:starch synthase
MTSLIPAYLKTLYKDEPVFKHSKVVYSVFENEFKESLGKDFARKATLNEIPDKQLETFGKGDNKSMHMGGVKHADAVVDCCTSKIDPELAKLFKAKPNMVHDNDNIGEKYYAFYEQLMTSAK